MLRVIQEFLENSCLVASYFGCWRVIQEFLEEFFWQVILRDILTICLIFDCTSDVSVHINPPEAQFTFAGKRFMTS